MTGLRRPGSDWQPSALSEGACLGPDFHSGCWPADAQQLQQIGARQRDAAFGRPVFGMGAVQEDRAAQARSRRIVVVAKRYDEIVEAVFPPQALMAPAVRQRHGPIIGRIRRVVRPAAILGQRVTGQDRARRIQAVGPEEKPAHWENPGWRPAVALAFDQRNPRTAKRNPHPAAGPGQPAGAGNADEIGEANQPQYRPLSGRGNAVANFTSLSAIWECTSCTVFICNSLSRRNRS